MFIFIMNSVVLLPLVPFAILFDLHLGRLSVIKEARGKARVIGITDN